MVSNAEAAFATYWQQYGMAHGASMPELTSEYKFHPTRKWRFDFAHVKSKTAIEIDGGVANRRKMGHTSLVGYTRDCTKRNAARDEGWQVYRFTPQMIDADPFGCIRQILNAIERNEEIQGMICDG